MRAELRQLFLEVAQKEFEFLVIGGKFRGPLPELDARTGIFTVTFMGNNLAVELVLDIRDQDVSCMVARIIGDRPAEDYMIDQQGRRVRDYLTSLLEQHGISRTQLVFEKVTKGMSLSDQIPILLRNAARRLQSYGQMVLDDSSAFLDVI